MKTAPRRFKISLEMDLQQMKIHYVGHPLSQTIVFILATQGLIIS